MPPTQESRWAGVGYMPPRRVQAGATSLSQPVAQSYTKPRTWSFRGMKGLAWMREIDCRTSCSKSPNASSANAGRSPVSASMVLLGFRACAQHTCVQELV